MCIIVLYVPSCTYVVIVKGPPIVTTLTVNASSDWTVGPQSFTRSTLVFATRGNGIMPTVLYCKTASGGFCYSLSMTQSVLKVHLHTSYHIFKVDFLPELLASPQMAILEFVIMSFEPIVMVTINSDIMSPMVYIHSSVIPDSRPTLHFAANTGGKRSSEVPTELSGIDKQLSSPHHHLSKRNSACSHQDYTVVFSEVGVTNVLAPSSLNIGQCTGVCPPGQTHVHNGVKHTELLDISIAADPSKSNPTIGCTPVDYVPASILYENSVLVVEPNMVVRACGCR